MSSSKIEIDHSNGRAFIADGELYYSPNCARQVSVPKYYEDDLNLPYAFANHSFESFSSPRWWSQPYGYLSFVPINPAIVTSAFAALRETGTHIVEIATPQGLRYGLDHSKTAQWEYVENYMLVIVRLLKDKYLLLPFLPPTPPSLIGFSRSFLSRHAATTHLTMVRDWYAVWLGLILFIVTYVEERYQNTGIPHWFQFLVQEGVSQAWLDGLRDAVGGQVARRTDRVGVFINPFNLRISRQPTVKFFVHWHIPVWYRWSKDDADRVSTLRSFQYLQPPPEILQAATSFMTRSPGHTTPYASASTHLESTSPPSSAAPICNPDVSTQGSCSAAAAARSSQDQYIKSKPWERTFSARRVANARLLALEETDPIRRERRLNRERHPPTASAQVFVWGWSDDDPNILARTSVRKDDRSDTLAHYPDSQKIYDPISNQWDVCEFFAPPEEGWESSEDDLRPDNDNDDDGSTNFRSEIDKTATFIEERDKKLPSPLSCAPQLHGMVVDDVSDPLNLLQYLTDHYGYLPPLPLPAEPEGFDPDLWNELVKTIGLVASSNHLPPDPRMRPSMIQFLRGLQGTGPPPALWDLDMSSRSPVDRDSLLQRIPRVGTFFFVDCQSLLQSQSDSPWILAIPCSRDVIKVYREICKGSSSKISLAHWLLKSGIQFRTMLTLSSPSSISLPISNLLLPIRMSDNYRFSVEDYQEYVRKRTQILQSPRGRAALLRGGILSRIAQEHLGLEAAYIGPSIDIKTHGTGFTYIAPNGIQYVDDELTETEINIICGLYICYTGNGEQTENLSWWPLPTQWDNDVANGHNLHHWTQWNELFYCQRVADIQSSNGKGVPLNATKWRSRLKGAKSWKKVNQRITTTSNAIVNGGSA